MNDKATPSGRWIVSFHGGDGPHARNNLHAYGADGTHLGKLLDTDGMAEAERPRELRGFAFGPDGDLYVANAWKGDSRVLRFAGAPDADGTHAFRGVFARRDDANLGLDHPFHVAFGPDGNLFVPSQDSGSVGRYGGPTGSAPGAPMPHPPALRELAGKGKLHPGTFVPSARHADDGLRAVRHVLFGPRGLLWVADREADRVSGYDPATGERVHAHRSRRFAGPVHLLHHPADGTLLVGSRDGHAVLRLDPTTGEHAPLVQEGAGGLREPSGLAWGPDGLLYVASRTGRSVLRFDPATGQPAGDPFLADLPDAPEFLLWVPGGG
jgi:hypothetical protein